MSSVPQTPPATQGSDPHIHTVTPEDLLVLDQLISNASPPTTFRKFHRREAPLDPLIIAAAVSSGPHLTRHHQLHGFFPTDVDDFPTHARDNWLEEPKPQESIPPRYISQQKPRRERLREQEQELQQRQSITQPYETPRNLWDTLPPSTDTEALHKVLSEAAATSADPKIPLLSSTHSHVSTYPSLPLRNSPFEPVRVQCRARTRIPTPHGPVFLHVYHNNVDSKEHLAIVVDPEQLANEPAAEGVESIRSRSLDATWRDGETNLERVIRGAYVGRLSPSSAVASSAQKSLSGTPSSSTPSPAPIVRLHSECYTGETIGSMRCDCGEQLDEAIRIISTPQQVETPNGAIKTVPGRGAVIYLRQEGRGIGLLEKVRAYNLQDMGFDTVTANLLLGHGADERGYDVAVAIMDDLGLAGESGVRLLTNNPEKMGALKDKGVTVRERVPMVPRSWKCGNEHSSRQSRGSSSKTSARNPSTHNESSSDESLQLSFLAQRQRKGGATLIGGGATYGPELERYLRTKIERMGHMLDLPTVSSLTFPTPTNDSDEEQESRSVDSFHLPRTPDLESDRESISPVSRAGSPSR